MIVQKGPNSVTSAMAATLFRRLTRVKMQELAQARGNTGGGFYYLVSMELLLQHQRVDSIRIVSGPSLDDGVSMALVELEGAEIVDGGFEADGLGSGGAQAVFGGLQQERTDTGATGGSDDVDGDDVADLAGVSDDEADDFVFAAIAGNFAGDQRKRSAVFDVELKFLTRIGDARRETFLIELPKSLEVFWLEIAHDEGHGDIVAGFGLRLPASGFRLRMQHFRLPGFARTETRGRLSPHRLPVCGRRFPDAGRRLCFPQTR